MNHSIEYTAEDEIADVRMKRPHVIILGAGASRAVCPNGDKHGRVLPLMADFSRVLGLNALLEEWEIPRGQNFEDTYSDLSEKGEVEKLRDLNERVEAYFGSLELPDHPTLYDHLILSLRPSDIIATFNWDPLLLQAYRRNPREFGRPRLAFLHGNLLVGYCDEDEVTGNAGRPCSICGKPLQRTPLLYPVRNKNYASDTAIAKQWELLKAGMREAFMLTIFGYSGPKTDKEAIAAMSEAWGNVTEREMEQTAFITLQSEEEVREAWAPFIHTHHFEVQSAFSDSWIARHPRRTGEAYLSQYLDARFVYENRPPDGVGFQELWDWFSRLLLAEQSLKGDRA